MLNKFEATNCHDNAVTRKPLHGQYWKKFIRMEDDKEKILTWLTNSGIKEMTNVFLTALEDYRISFIYHQIHIRK